MVRAGDYREKIRIEVRTSTQNAEGEPYNTWTTLATVRCAIQRQNGRETFDAHQREGRVPTIFRIRYSSQVSTISPAMRLVLLSNNAVYNIISAVDQGGRREEILIVAEEHVGETAGPDGGPYVPPVVTLDADKVNVSAISGLSADDAQGAFAEHQSDIEALQAADTTLQANIDAEAASRGDADDLLDGRVTANEADIASLQTDLSTEQTTRAAADSALDGRVTSNEADITEIVRERDETTVDTDFTDASAFEVVNTTITNPAARYTTSVNDGDLVISQSQASVMLIGPLLPTTDVANKLLRVVASYSGIGTHGGICLSFNPSSPTAIDTSNHLSINWRGSNGGITVYRQDGTTSANAALTFSPSLASSALVTYGDGDEVEITALFGDDPSEFTLRFYKNGEKVNEFAVSGLPTAYVGALSRGVGPGCVCTISELSLTHKNTQERAFYINGAAGAGGNGTEAAPFTTLQEAILRAEESPGKLKLYLKGGIYRGTIQLPGYIYREIEIIGRAGDETIIRGSTLVSDGWTKTSGYTNVYERAHTFGGVSPSNNAGGCVIDFSNPTALLDYRIYSRLSPNGALATLDSTPGACMVNTSAKKMYVHAYGSVDPNGLTLELADRQFGVGIVRATGDEDAAYYCSVRLRNLVAQYAYSHAFALQRCFIDIENCTGEGSGVSNGFGLDDVEGKLYGCVAQGNYNDGFNAAGAVTLDRYPQLHFFDCRGLKNVAGDGMSNHNGTWHVHGGEFSDNGKDGLVPAHGSLHAYGVAARRNASNGFQLASALTGESTEMRMVNCESTDNVNGVQCNRSTTGGVSTVEIEGGRIADNSSRGLYVFNSSGDAALAVMVARNVKQSGNPTESTNAGGTLTIVNDGAFS